MIKLRGDGVVWQSIEGEIVVLDTDASVYLSVKGSGAALWPLLVEGASRDDLVACLVQRYSIAPERAGVDVDSFVGGLQRRKLLDA